MTQPATRQSEWLSWQETPWFSRNDDAASAIRLGERLLVAAAKWDQGLERFLKEHLAMVATELSVQWAAVMDRTPTWQPQIEWGRHRPEEFPRELFDDVLDRDSAAMVSLEQSAGWSMIALPLPSVSFQNSLVAMTGRNLSTDLLPSALALVRVLGYAIELVRCEERSGQQIKRLRAILRIASELATVRETQPLLERIAEEATSLLDCDRASIFIWDKERKEVVACPALGVEDGTLRLSDRQGIVGQVIQSGERIRVDDAYRDARFDQTVDRETGYSTRNLLCVPLRDAHRELIGAFEVINKNNNGPFNEDDEESLVQLGLQAAIAIQNTREREDLIRSRQHLAEEVTQTVQIIGESPAIVALRETVDRLAATDLPVLILGESGTGKEVVARALHFQGPRVEQPFIAVNCAALTETLLESELFGHEEGAFTDARETRLGKFELAQGGTIFLDEIGDMSLGGQAKLLRVLEQKVITRVGGSQTIPINVRVVAATNANLVEKVRNRKFREDLYYRLSVVTQTLPPLRERPEDILILAEFFLSQFCRQAGRSATLPITADARRRLQAHSWPGNVRELRNLMERVAFLCTGQRVESDDLAFILNPDQSGIMEPSLDLGLNDATKEFQREFIRLSIKRVQGNMSEAARLLGLHRSNLYRKMRQLEMEEDEPA